MGWTTGVQLPVGAMVGFLLFSTAYRPAVGPTQPTIQWVLGAFTMEVKLLGREADPSPPSSTEVKNTWSCTSTPPICLLGVVLKQYMSLHGMVLS